MKISEKIARGIEMERQPSHDITVKSMLGSTNLGKVLKNKMLPFTFL